MFSLFDRRKHRLYILSETTGVYVRRVPKEADLSQVAIHDNDGATVLFESTQLECEHFLEQVFVSLRCGERAISVEDLEARAVGYAADALAKIKAESGKAESGEEIEL